MTSNEIYMTQALNKAWEYQLKTYPNPAVGALVLRNNEIIALQAHQKAGTSHAEVLVLLEAYESISKKTLRFDRFDADKAHAFLYTLPEDFFAQCIVFVTLEPCAHVGQTPSCASLLAHLKPKKVIVATLDPIVGHDGGLKRLEAQGIEVEVGVCEEQALRLLEPFLIWQKRAFVLFKIAQTSNGRIGGGYLSSEASLTDVHMLRECCDMLLIGGNTVRVDRPTLDCRFTQGKAPDIKIYTKRDDLDREIPLFKIPHRSVEIVSHLYFLDTPSFILVEGGEGMLRAMQEKIDWVLFYQTSKLSSHHLSYNIDMNLHFLHQTQKDVDLVIWSKQMQESQREYNNQKQEKIVGMFDDIASTYDLANRVLSFGIDKQWRKKGCNKAYDILDRKHLTQITDVATGTGDLLLYWRDIAHARGIEVEHFVGVDPSIGMLDVAKTKVDFATFIEGKAQRLPIADESTDIISISYGIRNVVDRVEALEAFYRALKPGGIVVILEFTKQKREGFVNKIVDFGMKKVLPKVGGFISKNYEAYQYLPESIEAFLTTEMLEDELKASGFEMRYSKSFSMGISTLLVAQKQ